MKKTINNSAERFREVRATFGLTQKDLAGHLLLSPNYVAQIEMGRREPSMRIICALEALQLKLRAVVSGLPDSQIIYGSGAGHPAARGDVEDESHSTRRPGSHVPSSGSSPEPTRAQLERDFARMLDRHEYEPDGLSHIRWLMRRHFPLDESGGGPTGKNKMSEPAAHTVKQFR